jgi:hypothetical protein
MSRNSLFDYFRNLLTCHTVWGLRHSSATANPITWGEIC